MEEKEIEDIQYITFLLMARAGLRALEFYDPATRKHGQAHMQARYGFILAAPDCLSIYDLGQAWYHSAPHPVRYCKPGESLGCERRAGKSLRPSKTCTILLDNEIPTQFLFCQVDRSLVLSRGKEVVGNLLIELQVRKSTADAIGSREFYTNLTKPIAGWEGEIRDLVLKKKLVRPGSPNPSVQSL